MRAILPTKNILCEAVPGCLAPAVVIVADREGGRANVCPFHHQDMMRASDGLIRGVGLVRSAAAEPAEARAPITGPRTGERLASRDSYEIIRAIPIPPVTVGPTTVTSRMLRTVLTAITGSEADAVVVAGRLPGLATIAERAECSVSTVRRALHALERLGVLAITSVDGSRRYQVVAR